MIPESKSRASWTREDYVGEIKYWLRASLYDACILIAELKNKYFSLDKEDGWINFCKDTIGISRHYAADCVRICKYVIPYVERPIIDKLGIKKLVELAKLKNFLTKKDVLDEIFGDMGMVEVKKLVNKYVQFNSGKKRRSLYSLKNDLIYLERNINPYLKDTTDLIKLSKELHIQAKNLLPIFNIIVTTGESN